MMRMEGFQMAILQSRGTELFEVVSESWVTRYTAQHQDFEIMGPVCSPTCIKVRYAPRHRSGNNQEDDEGLHCCVSKTRNLFCVISESFQLMGIISLYLR